MRQRNLKIGRNTQFQNLGTVITDFQNINAGRLVERHMHAQLGLEIAFLHLENGGTIEPKQHIVRRVIVFERIIRRREPFTALPVVKIDRLGGHLRTGHSCPVGGQAVLLRVAVGGAVQPAVGNRQYMAKRVRHFVVKRTRCEWRQHAQRVAVVNILGVLLRRTRQHFTVADQRVAFRLPNARQRRVDFWFQMLANPLGGGRLGFAAADQDAQRVPGVKQHGADRIKARIGVHVERGLEFQGLENARRPDAAGAADKVDATGKNPFGLHA